MEERDLKVFVGYISVDSGQVMVVDPCYLNEWEGNEFNFKAGLRNRKTGDLICCWDEVPGIGKIRWDTPLPQYGGRCMNALAEDKENWEKYQDYPDAGEFSYSGVSGMTCKKTFGQFSNGLAVASSTYNGDGRYPVFAITERISGKVKQIIIDFYGKGR